jgi:pilus assembly protein CpaF
MSAIAPQRNAEEMSRYLDALGPLRPLVEDDSLTEIMVNGPDMVYVERSGKILLTDVRFDDENHLLRVIDLIVSAVGRRIDYRRSRSTARCSPSASSPRTPTRSTTWSPSGP